MNQALRSEQYREHAPPEPPETRHGPNESQHLPPPLPPGAAATTTDPQETPHGISRDNAEDADDRSHVYKFQEDDEDQEGNDGGNGGLNEGGNEAVAGAPEEGSKGDQHDSSALPSLQEVFRSVLMTIQCLAVWISLVATPPPYVRTFQESFAALSLDLTTVLQSNPLLTPLIQFFFGVILSSVLFYFVEADKHLFLSSLARYVLQRCDFD